MTIQKKPDGSLLARVRASVQGIALAADPKAVHFFRTSCRRLEAYAALAGGEYGRRLRKLSKRLGKARRLAGRVRDLDVQLELLREEVGREHEERRLLLADLQEARGRAARKLARELDEEEMDALRARIVKAGRAERGSAQAISGLRTRAWEQAVEAFTALSRDFPKAGTGSLHELRLACKRVRYTAEQALPLPAAATLVEQMKRVQDAIGLWHDWVVLGERAGKVLPGDSTLFHLLRARERTSRAEALKRAREVTRPHIRVEPPPVLPAAAKAPEHASGVKPQVASAS